MKKLFKGRIDNKPEKVIQRFVDNVIGMGFDVVREDNRLKLFLTDPDDPDETVMPGHWRVVWAEIQSIEGGFEVVYRDNSDTPPLVVEVWAEGGKYYASAYTSEMDNLHDFNVEYRGYLVSSQVFVPEITVIEYVND